MKRTFLAVLSTSLLFVAAPSVASAHHARHHAACRASTHHHARCAHARAHVLSFGPVTSTPSGATGTTNPAPTTPASNETAGTVTSWVAPVLTITLNDKKTEVSGKVTESTHIFCESATASPGGEEGDDDGGTEGSGDSHVSGGHGDSAIASDFHSGDEGDSGDGGNLQPCTTSAFVLGTVVRAAELALGGEGAVWEKLILVS